MFGDNSSQIVETNHLNFQVINGFPDRPWTCYGINFIVFVEGRRGKHFGILTFVAFWCFWYGYVEECAFKSFMWIIITTSLTASSS